MSSFYGGAGIPSSGSGNGFPTETGTSSSPIILNDLDYGNYIINGNFLYTSNDTEDKEATYDLLVTIMEDPNTGQKVAKYETVEDGICYIYTIGFDDNGNYQLNKMSIGSSSGVIFIDDISAMPTQGIEGFLYVGWQSIYRWDASTGVFVQLTSASEADLSNLNYEDEPVEGEFVTSISQKNGLISVVRASVTQNLFWEEF